MTRVVEGPMPREPGRPTVWFTCVSLVVGSVIASMAARDPLVLQPQRDEPRILAIGDIHGSYDGLTAILRRTGVVNEQLRWAGGRTVVVQTGDYTDRGAGVRKVLDLIMQ